MNAGRDYNKALEQAKANAARTNSPRFLFYNRVYFISPTRPCGSMITGTYDEIRPDGTIIKDVQPEV